MLTLFLFQEAEKVGGSHFLFHPLETSIYGKQQARKRKGQNIDCLE